MGPGKLGIQRVVCPQGYRIISWGSVLLRLQPRAFTETSRRIIALADENRINKQEREAAGAGFAARPRTSPATWLIAVSLAVIAVCLVMRTGASGGNPVYAQSVGSGGARGIFAFTGQLSKDSYGVFMVDVDAGTLWCYRFASGRNALRLVAARDWRFDRYLTEFATDPPIATIKEQLDQQRAAMQNGAP
jgi:hypothetical protein